MSAELNFSTVPYPGLRPYEPEESDIFFGREKQTDELLDTLHRSRFLSVVGPSGCGKSSLVRAGLVASLRTGFMAEAGSSWRIALMRPGDRPIGRLAEALRDSGMVSGEGVSATEAQLLTEAALRRGPLGLVEVVREARRPKENLLVLVDQFEELFRYHAGVDSDQAEAFVALLLAACEQRQVSIYVVITMRSDFIGDCALFHGLPEAINHAQYLTPRLTREECQSAILGPARVFGGEVDPDLVNRLLNDFGSDPDQLPLLQHVLLRMWQLRTATSSGTGVTLDVADYQAVGGMNMALSYHADEAFEELGADRQRVAEVLFKHLTERQEGRRDTRSPARLGEIAETAACPVDDVRAVIEAFRRPDRCFLAPRAGELGPATVIDLSHESLIRQWRTLSRWVDEEAESASIYRRLKDTARLWLNKDAGLWGTPDLDRALQWHAKQKPTSAWARRYGTHDEFACALTFLDASQAARVAENERREKQRLRDLRRARFIATAFAAATVILMAGGLLAFYLGRREYTAYYNGFDKVYGAARGYGRLQPSQVDRRSVSFRIVRRGRLGRVVRVEAVDSRRQLTSLHGLPTYLNNETAERTARWDYTYDDAGRVASEVASDARGKRLWSFVYAPAEKSASKRSGSFVGADGFPLGESMYQGVVTIEYDGAGFEKKILYHGPGGNPRPGPDHAFGREMVRDGQGRIVDMVSLNAHGKPMNDTAGNAVWRSAKMDALGNDLEAQSLGADGKPITLKDGWARRLSTYDSAGRLTECSFYDETGRPTVVAGGFHRVRYDLDERGNTSAESYWGLSDEPVSNANGCHRLQNQSDDRGLLVDQRCLDAKRQPISNGEGVWRTTFVYSEHGDVTQVATYGLDGRQVNSTQGYSRAVTRYDAEDRPVEYLYYGPDDKPALNKGGYFREVRTYDDRGRELTRAFYSAEKRLVTADDGWAMRQLSYDLSGHVVARRYLGPDEKPIRIASGESGSTSRYDDQGNEVEVIFRGERGEPVDRGEGEAGYRSEYDAVGNLTRLIHIGIDGLPTRSGSGEAGWTSRFDDHGNEIERRYFGIDNKPMVSGMGSAGWRSRWDARNNEIERTYLDGQGNLLAVRWEGSDDESSSHAIIRKTFGSRGNEVLTEAHFGVHGEPVAGPEGWSSLVSTYDLRGRETSTTYFGLFGQPVRTSKGYQRVEWRYVDASDGGTVEVTYYDLAGKPTFNQAGYAKIRRRNDRLGRLLEESVYDTNDRPVESKDGRHRTVYVLDRRGRVLEERYFGASNQPTATPEGTHLGRMRYDEGGRVVEWSLWGLDGRPVSKRGQHARVVVVRDPHGDVVERRFLGADGQPFLTPEGYAAVKYALGPLRSSQEDRQLLRTQYLGRNDEPVTIPEGYAEVRRTYDNAGRELETRYFDVRGRPTVERKERVAAIKRTYDTIGNLTAEAYFDGHDAPMSGRAGYHRFEQQYNTRRQIVSGQFVDTAGRLTRGADFGAARFTFDHDQSGRLTAVATFAADGRPVIAKFGYARMIRRYDAAGNTVELAFYGPSGRLMAVDGAARTVSKYDERGNAIEQRYFDSSDRPTSPIARSEREFDRRRLLITERWFGPSGKPPVGTAHLVRYEYDVAGNRTAMSYYGAHGEKALAYCPNHERGTRWVATYDAKGNKVSESCKDELLERTFGKYVQAYRQRMAAAQRAAAAEVPEPTPAVPLNTAEPAQEAAQ